MLGALKRLGIRRGSVGKLPATQELCQTRLTPTRPRWRSSSSNPCSTSQQAGKRERRRRILSFFCVFLFGWVCASSRGLARGPASLRDSCASVSQECSLVHPLRICHPQSRVSKSRLLLLRMTPRLLYTAMKYKARDMQKHRTLRCHVYQQGKNDNVPASLTG